jgi:hypothetical protein
MTMLEVMGSLLQNTETQGIFKERVCDFRFQVSTAVYLESVI